MCMIYIYICICIYIYYLICKYIQSWDKYRITQVLHQSTGSRPVLLGSHLLLQTFPIPGPMGPMASTGAPRAPIGIRRIAGPQITAWWLSHPSEKCEVVSWDDENPNIYIIIYIYIIIIYIYGRINFMFQTTNQIIKSLQNRNPLEMP